MLLDSLMFPILAAGTPAEMSFETVVETVPDSKATGLLFWVCWMGVLAMIVGMGMCLIRMMRGPHLADRVLAADALSLHVVGLVLLLSVSIESTVYFDLALVLAIIGFASTVAFSQYIFAKAEQRDFEASQQPHDDPASTNTATTTNTEEAAD